LDKGVKVGLGSDVSGGYSPSILNAIQNATPRHGTAADAAGATTAEVADAEVGLEEKQKIVRGWLECFLHGGDDRNIERVYVQGHLVGGRTFRTFPWPRFKLKIQLVPLPSMKKLYIVQ